MGLLVLGLLAGCGAGAETPRAKGPRLRITNRGEVPIEGLVVLFPEAEIAFGDVAPGETTGYQVVREGVYRYAAYRFQAGGETVTQPVIDWVGEEPMPGESFTYVVEYDPGRPLLQRIQLVDVVEEE